MGISIRNCREGDAELLQQMRLAMLEDSPLSFNVDVAATQRYGIEWWTTWSREAAEAKDTVIFFAENSAVVGIIAGRRRGSVAHIGALWVAPAQRRRGVAGLLLEAAEAWARDVGARTVELSVASGNEAGLRLYYQRHYVDTGRRIITRHEDDELVLSKPA